MLKRYFRTWERMLLSLSLISLGLPTANALAQSDVRPLPVAATVPELGSLVREVGGDLVAVTVFAKGMEDPHFVEAKPIFIKMLSQADLFIQIGMENEAGWAPVLLQNARNSRILPGARRFLDASTAIVPLDVPTGPVDCSLGDVHAAGNPHYLLDPVNGLKAARLIRDRLIELRPDKRHAFEQRYFRGFIRRSRRSWLFFMRAEDARRDYKISTCESGIISRSVSVSSSSRSMNMAEVFCSMGVQRCSYASESDAALR